MKKFLFFFLFLTAGKALLAQNISQVIIAQGDLKVFVINLEQNLTIYLGKDGHILNYGFDKYAAAGIDNYQDKLEPYAGRVDNYTALDDSAFRGKERYIGRYPLTYYASYDKPELRGKLKSFGSLTFDYYGAFENEAFRGKLKNIGYNPVSWFSSYDNEALKGKLKSFGPTSFTWYTSFDDVLIRGKVKSIGNATFTWYSSFDLVNLRGNLKSGLPNQVINGVRYLVRY